jgi:putative methyltransferase (TIGR04325 family)
MRSIFGKNSTEGETFVGRYSSFKDVFENYPDATKYHSNRSLQELVDLATQAVSSFRRLASPEIGWDIFRLNILPTALSVMGSHKVIKVLDVGGGLGACYLNLKRACPQKGIHYTIIDLPETVEQGKDLFSAFSDIEFIKEFPPEASDFDVVLFGSSLQYFQNYQDIVKLVCSYDPEVIILADHPMGIAEIFVCAQINMADRVILFNVFNIDELLNLFEAQGYAPVLKTLSYYPFHDFSNYNDEVSKTRFYNFIFSRKITTR